MLNSTFILLLLPLALTCPATVADELDLISQPLDCFRQLYDHTKFDNQRMVRVVNERLQSYQRILQQLKMSAEEYHHTTPVLKWAQNFAQIYISFKLSHRQDSPTCSDVRKESFITNQIAEAESDIQYQLTNNTQTNISSFNYSGECFFTTQKFRFTLSLAFQKAVQKVVLRRQGLGLYTLIVNKDVVGVWARPFTGYRTAAIWTELRQKYDKSMDQYFEMLDQEAQESKPRKKKRRPKKTEEAEL